MKTAPFYITTICILSIFLSCQTDKELSQRPNILFAIMDDATWHHMSAYGCQWVDTPAFDYVASNGLLFNRAYTPNAKCAPSRSCILTGRNTWQLEEAVNHWPLFPAKFKTFPEVLIENGYHVGHTAKGWAPGIAGEVNGKKRELIGPAYNNKTLDPPTNAISKNDYAANFSDFLDANVDREPFFFWYGSIEPHRAYEYQSGVKKAGKSISHIDRVYSFWPDNEVVRHDLLDYAMEIEYFDLHLQTMIDELKERGELDNTLIVVTADNGMPFPRVKGQEYELSNHLPLTMMWPNGIKTVGRKVNDFISFIDFAPSFLELAGIKQIDSGMQSITGKSLTNILEATTGNIVDETRDHILIGKERHDVGRPDDQGYPIRGIVKGDYLYVQNFEPGRWPAGDPVTGYLNCDGSPTKTECLNTKPSRELRHFWAWNFGKRPKEEFYNIRTDPECMLNLAKSREVPKEMLEMQYQMIEELKEQGDPRMFGQGDMLEGYKYMDEKTTNFYNRYTSGEELKAGWVNLTDFENVE